MLMLVLVQSELIAGECRSVLLHLGLLYGDKLSLHFGHVVDHFFKLELLVSIGSHDVAVAAGFLLSL